MGGPLRPRADLSGAVAQVGHLAAQRGRAVAQGLLRCGRFTENRLQSLPNVPLALGQFRGIV